MEAPSKRKRVTPCEGKSEGGRELRGREGERDHAEAETEREGGDQTARYLHEWLVVEAVTCLVWFCGEAEH